MMRFESRHVERLAAAAALCAMGLGAAGCDVANASAGPGVGVLQQEIQQQDLLKQCGFVCPGDTDADGIKVLGVADGNATISGVASVDAFFGSVLHLKDTANSVAGGIQAQLGAIRGDFGFEANADIVASIRAQIDGELKVVAEPARCSIDINASIEATAKCDAEFDPGKAEVKCTGGCDLDVKAPEIKCDAEAELSCTVVAPEVRCMGQCSGTCELSGEAAASCSGTCNGACEGTCSAYAKDSSGTAQCAGSCSGTCKGTCDVELSANLDCSGKCKGECTMTGGSAKCDGAVRASCTAKDPEVGIKCDGRCDTNIVPPKAKAECEASAKAQASANVQCTPPHVAVTYKLKASLEGEARAKFDAALTSFVKVRLPALLAEVKRAELVREAGTELGASVGTTVKSSFMTRMGDSKLSLKSTFGLACAAGEIDATTKILADSASALKTQIDAAAKVSAVLTPAKS
jgi:hypothetical protein